MTWRLKNSGVKMTPNLTSFMDALSLLVPFDLVVTSGFRTPEAQATAMFTKIDLGEDLTKLYRNQSFANAVTEAYPSHGTAAAVIAEFAASGGGSTHLRGIGIDLRTRDFTISQRNELKTAVESMGDFALYEPTPPHLHIELKKNYGQKMNWPILAALVAGVFLWMRKPTRGT